jgi:extracellular factor (EF) 3-hydroxypalmitic acid methyl ester biosynthesis protein
MGSNERKRILKHESFEVSSDSSKRLKVVRQDRINVENDRVYIETNKAKYPVINYSTFGTAVRVEKDQSISNEFSGVFVYDDIEIGKYNFRLVRIEPYHADSNNLALEVVGEPISVDTILAVKMAKQAIHHQNKTDLSFATVPNAFKSLVFEMKDFLEILKRNLEGVENEVRQNGNRHADDYQETIAQVIGKYLQSIFPVRYAEASKSIADQDDETVKCSMEFFRQKIGDLIYRVPIVDRIYSKPLGYAGDFEMMNIIYKTKSGGRSLFEKSIHNFFVTDPSAQAVRNRSDYLCEKIGALMAKNKGQNVKILSLACGPAFEIQKALRKGLIDSSDRVEIVLLDQDENALKNAQFELKNIQRDLGLKLNIRMVNNAIKNVIVKGLADEGFDLIYSAGLFDYFSDPVAQLAAQKLVTALNDNGQLLIGNFDVSTPSKPIMEIALDWQLIYRSEEDLFRLFGHVGSGFRVEKEDLGINLFCIIDK